MYRCHAARRPADTPESSRVLGGARGSLPKIAESPPPEYGSLIKVFRIHVFEMPGETLFFLRLLLADQERPRSSLQSNGSHVSDTVSRKSHCPASEPRILRVANLEHGSELQSVVLSAKPRRSPHKDLQSSLAHIRDPTCRHLLPNRIQNPLLFLWNLVA